MRKINVNIVLKIKEEMGWRFSDYEYGD